MNKNLSGQTMQVSFRYTITDLYWPSFWIMLQAGAGIWLLPAAAMMNLAYGVNWLLSGSPTANAQELAVGLLSGFCFPFLVFVGIPLFTYWSIRKSLMSPRFSTVSVQVDAEGLGLQLVGEEHRHAWANVTKVRETAGFFVFFIHAHAAIILPKRTIQDAEDLGRLRHYIQTCCGRIT